MNLAESESDWRRVLVFRSRLNNTTYKCKGAGQIGATRMRCHAEGVLPAEGGLIAEEEQG